MPYNRTIQIRLSDYERERILNRMREEGFHNLSAWARRTLMEGEAIRGPSRAHIIHELPCTTDWPLNDAGGRPGAYGGKSGSDDTAAYYPEFSGENPFLCPKRY